VARGEFDRPTVLASVAGKLQIVMPEFVRVETNSPEFGEPSGLLERETPVANPRA
jgi:hypothetical protein